VTGDVIGSGGDPANYVLVPIETTALAVDLNHNGDINFDDASDKTTAAHPFVFGRTTTWIFRLAKMSRTLIRLAVLPTIKTS